MRKWVFVLLILFLLASFCAAFSPDGKPSRVIVVLNDDPGDLRAQGSGGALEDGTSSKKSFSTIASPDVLAELKSDPRVSGVYPDQEVHIFLSESVPLINASSVWSLNVLGVNITGAGQTVCVVDTGVDYTHPDLGGCDPLNVSLTADPVNVSVESSHPYANSFDYIWTITEPGFSQVAVHFSNLSLEEEWDFLYVMDAEGAVYETLTGAYSDLWTLPVPGDTVKIRLVADELITDYGFSIDQVVNGSFSASWNCSKVIGGYDFINHDPDPLDDHDHGTHCAGIVAGDGAIKGVAPDSRIVAVKSLDAAGHGYDSDILSGINYCVSHAEEYNISVISMSLGGGLFSSYCDATLPYYASAINSAVEKNISVVVATGNDHSAAGISAPACIYNATAVGSSDDGSGGTVVDVLTPTTTNRGVNFPRMLLAPGRWITSSVVGGYSTWSGTSMATPHVAGAAALLRQYLDLTSQNMSPGELESLLNDTGKAVFDAGTGLYFSRIDVYSSLNSLDPIPVASVVSSQPFTKENYSVLNWTCLDPEGENMTSWIYGFNGSSVLLTSQAAASNVSYAFNWTGLSDDQYSWWVSCDDGIYNVSSGNVSFTVDSTTPFLSFMPPTPGNSSVTDFNSITFNVSFSDEHPESLIFYLNGSASPVNYSGSGAEFDRLLENGPYSFYFSLNDSAGNLNVTETRTFYVNATPPVVSLVSPNNSFFASEVNMSCSAVDDALVESVTLYWNYSGAWMANGSGNPSWFMRDVSGSSRVSWNCLACDNSSNCAFAEENMSFYVDSIAPLVSGNVSAEIVVNASNVSLSLNASDSYLNSSWAVVVFPDSSQEVLDVSPGSPYEFTANMTGYFNVTFFANDSAGNLANHTGHFLSRPPLVFNSSFYGFNSSHLNTSFQVYFNDSLIYSNQSDGVYATLPDYVFDLYFSSLNDSLRVFFYSVNLSANNNQSLGFDQGFNLSGYPVVYAINNSFSFDSASLNLSYAGVSYPDNSSLRVYKCANWSFPDQNCSGTWVEVDFANFPGPGYVFLNASGFSSYSIAQGPYCGDGVRDDGEACDGSDFGGASCSSYGYNRGSLSCSSSCLISTSGCYNVILGGGGGGSSGGGGAAGGMAKLLPSCFDGIQNYHDGLAEEGVDCGGSCSPCMSCSDGIQNQGEEGIDCGGPCEACTTTTTSTTTSSSTSSSTSLSFASSSSTSSSLASGENISDSPGFDFSGVFVFAFVLCALSLILYGRLRG